MQKECPDGALFSIDSFPSVKFNYPAMRGTSSYAQIHAFGMTGAISVSTSA